jgi:hypothetical protein
MQWFEEGKRPDGWKSLTRGTTVAGFMPPTAVSQRPTKWRSFKTALGEAAVAYDLSPRISRRATLYVVRTKRVYSVQSLPYTRLSTTGSVSAAAWQSDGYLYVLVIDNDGQRLDDFVTKPQLTVLPRNLVSRPA